MATPPPQSFHRPCLYLFVLYYVLGFPFPLPPSVPPSLHPPLPFSLLTQFKDTTTASEALFSLVNGDDMFNTYIQMSNISTPVWIFSKIYLYVFISLFIYVVLSVFIGLISDTYETLNVS